MPNCLTLTRRTDPDAGPVSLCEIDEEMCQHFGVPCDIKHYHHDWYPVVGTGLAFGINYEELINRIKERIENPSPRYTEEMQRFDQHLIEVIEWLRDNFVPNTWYESK